MIVLALLLVGCVLVFRWRGYGAGRAMLYGTEVAVLVVVVLGIANALP